MKSQVLNVKRVILHRTCVVQCGVGWFWAWGCSIECVHAQSATYVYFQHIILIGSIYTCSHIFR